MWLYIVVIGIALLAAVGTFWVGFSAENKKRNPEYEHRTKKNLSKLTSLYVVTVVLAIIICVAVYLR